MKSTDMIFPINFLALKNMSNMFFINGGWTVDWPRMFYGAGTVFNYERLDGQPEVIHSTGPTTEDVVFMVNSHCFQLIVYLTILFTHLINQQRPCQVYKSW